MCALVRVCVRVCGCVFGCVFKYSILTCLGRLSVLWCLLLTFLFFSMYVSLRYCNLNIVFEGLSRGTQLFFKSTHFFSVEPGQEIDIVTIQLTKMCFKVSLDFFISTCLFKKIGRVTSL